MVKAAPKKSESEVRISGKPLKKSTAAANEIPSVKEMTVVKNNIYTSCEKKRKMFSWVKCPKMLLDPLVDKVMKMVGAGPNDHFVDAGCGIGNVVAHVATRFGCDCTGIELTAPNYDVAVEAETKFAAYRRDRNLPQPSVNFIKGDLRQHLPSIIDTVDILWCTNLLFPIELNAFLLGQLYRMKPGSKVFIMTDLIPDKHNEAMKYFEKTKFQWGAGDVEWTNEPGDLYVYVRTAVPFVA